MSSKSLEDWKEQYQMLNNYKINPCTKKRTCEGGFCSCTGYHGKKDRRRSLKTFKYFKNECTVVKPTPAAEWGDPSLCPLGESCPNAHTRPEQQFHPEVYKSMMCKDWVDKGTCPRGEFCAFGHSEEELLKHRKWHFDLSKVLPGGVEKSPAKAPTDLLPSLPPPKVYREYQSYQAQNQNGGGNPVFAFEDISSTSCDESCCGNLSSSRRTIVGSPVKSDPGATANTPGEEHHQCRNSNKISSQCYSHGDASFAFILAGGGSSVIPGGAVGGAKIENDAEGVTETTAEDQGPDGNSRPSTPGLPTYSSITAGVGKLGMSLSPNKGAGSASGNNKCEEEICFTALPIAAVAVAEEPLISSKPSDSCLPCLPFEVEDDIKEKVVESNEEKIEDKKGTTSTLSKDLMKALKMSEGINYYGYTYDWNPHDGLFGNATTTPGAGTTNQIPREDWDDHMLNEMARTRKFGNVSTPLDPLIDRVARNLTESREDSQAHGCYQLFPGWDDFNKKPGTSGNKAPGASWSLSGVSEMFRHVGNDNMFGLMGDSGEAGGGNVFDLNLGQEFREGFARSQTSQKERESQSRPVQEYKQHEELQAEALASSRLHRESEFMEQQQQRNHEEAKRLQQSHSASQRMDREEGGARAHQEAKYEMQPSQRSWVDVEVERLEREQNQQRQASSTTATTANGYLSFGANANMPNTSIAASSFPVPGNANVNLGNNMLFHDHRANGDDQRANSSLHHGQGQNDGNICHVGLGGMTTAQLERAWNENPLSKQIQIEPEPQLINYSGEIIGLKSGITTPEQMTYHGTNLLVDRMRNNREEYEVCLEALKKQHNNHAPEFPCIICRKVSNPRTIIFHPCCHQVCCEMCCWDLRKCPLPGCDSMIFQRYMVIPNSYDNNPK